MAKLKKVTVTNVPGDILHTASLIPAHLADVAKQDKELPSCPCTFPVNQTAAALHPAYQTLRITKIVPFSKDIKSIYFTWVGSRPLAYFRAGQYLSFPIKIGSALVTRAYSIASSPAEALRGEYMITVKRVPDGFVSGWILDNWKVGDRITAYAPEGTFTYEPLRDAPAVVACAGGSGITPFLSMAKAIDEGTEDFSLTLLYGARNKKELVFKAELDEIAARNEKFKVVYVLSETKSKTAGFENGFINAELIKKYAPAEGKYSLFACGPEAMYNFLRTQLEELGLERKYVRFEMFGVSKNTVLPEESKEKTFRMTVIVNGESTEIEAKGCETVLTALERAGIACPVRCRSGECGFCRSKCVKGDVFIPDGADFRRIADAQFGYIHPCCSYPVSDLTVKVN